MGILPVCFKGLSFTEKDYSKVHDNSMNMGKMPMPRQNGLPHRFFAKKVLDSTHLKKP